MILGFLTKYRDYSAQVHTGPGGDTTSTSYTIMAEPNITQMKPPKMCLWAYFAHLIKRKYANAYKTH